MTTKSGRPTQVIVIAVIGLVLGSLGLFGGAMGTLSSLSQESMVEQQRALLGASGAPPQQVRMQLEILEATLEAQRPYMPFLIMGNLFNALASALLGIGCVLLLMGHARAPLAFGVTAGIAAFSDVLFGVLSYLVGMATSSVMSDSMTGMFEGIPNGGDAGAMMGIFGTAIGYITACWTAMWVLIKLSYYTGGALYLQRPHVKRTFEPAPVAPPML